MRQLAYGVVFESDLWLGVPPGLGEVRVTIGELLAPVDHDLIEWIDQPDPWMSAGTVGDDFYLCFEDEAEFLVSPDGRSIRWYSAEGPSETLVHLLLDHLLPRALTRSGAIVLHGSCIASDGRGCVAVVGNSGSGKSTLAAAMFARGHGVMADDCIVARCQDGRVEVAAAYPGLRLTDASVRISGAAALESRGSVSRYNDKKRMAPPSAGLSSGWDDATRRLRAVIVLPDPDHSADGSAEAGLRSLAPAAAGIELLRQSFFLTRPAERANVIDRVLSIADACPVLVLAYDHSELGLELAVKEIEALLIGGLEMPA